jgi:hypothetical protein
MLALKLSGIEGVPIGIEAILVFRERQLSTRRVVRLANQRDRAQAVVYALRNGLAS